MPQNIMLLLTFPTTTGTCKIQYLAACTKQAADCLYWFTFCPSLFKGLRNTLQMFGGISSSCLAGYHTYCKPRPCVLWYFYLNFVPRENYPPFNFSWKLLKVKWWCWSWNLVSMWLLNFWKHKHTGKNTPIIWVNQRK